MVDESREESVANSVRNVLKEGDAFQVYCVDGEIYVTEAGTSVCASKYPRLYGRLLSLNTSIEYAGSGVSKYPLLASAIFSVGIHLRWFDQWLPAELIPKLDSGWFFLVLCFVILAVTNSITNWMQKMAYRNGRDEILAMMDRESLDRDSLVTLLSEDESVSRVTWFLELDHDAGRMTTH